MKKTVLLVFGFFVVAVIILATGQPALPRGSQASGGGSRIQTDSTTVPEWSGPLTIVYECLEYDQNLCIWAGMDFFLRLKQGNELYVFSGYGEGPNESGSFVKIEAAQEVLDAFIRLEVIPKLYPGMVSCAAGCKRNCPANQPDCEECGDGCLHVGLHSVKNIMESDDSISGCCVIQPFSMLDVVIGVHD